MASLFYEIPTFEKMKEFKFKEFNVKQDLCAMKVGTDGVLLGAWSSVPDGKVLDIGSGTGLIALMIAQRNLNSLIDTIDVNLEAYNQTKGNVNDSKWKSRINVFHTSVQDFSSSHKYDLIISNPPFFSNSYKSNIDAKNIARHTDSLPFCDLVCKVSELLKEDGLFSVVLPTSESTDFINQCLKKELFINKICTVKPNPSKPAKRVLMEFSFTEKTIVNSEITIETEKRHDYTNEYRNLTKDFYLKF